MQTLENAPAELRDRVHHPNDPDTLGPVVAAVASLAAAWIAAGSVGLLAHPLKRVLTLVALAVAALALRPRSKAGFLLLPPALIIAVCLVALPMPVANIGAVALFLGLLACTARGQSRDILSVSATAVLIFAVYRLALTSVPWLWLLANLDSRISGSLASWISGQPLAVGPTFAGLDFVVLTGVLWVLYVPHTPEPQAGRALYGLAAILVGHVAYLVVVSWAPRLLAALPTQEGAGWSWAGLLHSAVPWNLPAVAGMIHVLIAAAVLRWSPWQHEIAVVSQETTSRRPARSTVGVRAVATALFLPLLAVLHPACPDLGGRKIVFYEKGFLNWLKPTHESYGRLSSGMYGMLPVFVESLGARALVSSDLSEADLKDAYAVVLIYPDEPWQEGQLERIHDYVRRGGSLLVMGEHTTRDPNGNNRFNEVLAPTKMRVRFDSATFAVGGWLQSYEKISHPITTGIDDSRNQFGVVIGASVAARWPARPLLMGRWGWADPGDEASERAMMGNGRYDPGERLGDVVLAAEQTLGKGRVVAFGDTSGLTNAINVSTHPFNARLFSYLAGGAGSAHPAWRQLLTILIASFLLALVGRPSAARTIVVTVALLGSLVVCTHVSEAGTPPLPDGRLKTPNNLAYIDASHVEAYSSESWRPDGVGGLALTLMRNGYLALALPELTRESLEPAGLLISVAPAREFSKSEVATIKNFVESGGTFVLTVGYERVGPSEPLLNAFGFRVGLVEDAAIEPTPMGHFKAPYLESEGKRVYVRFHAAWPVACSDPNTRPIAYGRDNRPVILMRRIGQGKVVLIGDTGFAMNKNLENESGAPFEGLRENAEFWRWFLTVLRDQEMWLPPMLRDSDANVTDERVSEEAGP